MTQARRVWASRCTSWACTPSEALCWAVRYSAMELMPCSGSAAGCQVPAVGHREVVEFWLRAPGAGGVWVDGGRVVQQRSGDLPQSFDLAGRREQGLVAEHGVHQEPLVAL